MPVDFSKKSQAEFGEQVKAKRAQISQTEQEVQALKEKAQPHLSLGATEDQDRLENQIAFTEAQIESERKEFQKKSSEVLRNRRLFAKFCEMLFDDETGSDNFLEMRRDFGKITQAFFIPKDGKYFKEDVYLRESRPQESFLNLFIIHDTPTNEQFKALSAYLNNGSEVAAGTDPNNPNELSADWLAKN